jgi:purine-binding chemotaxis protein CheW
VRPAPQGQVPPGTGSAVSVLVPGAFLSFYLDGHRYAVSLALVAEIIPPRELNAIPHMPREVEGLLTHRGSVLPVINLRSRMHLGSREANPAGNIVLLDLGGASLVGIRVDAVDTVITAAEEQLVAASPLLAGAQGAWALGFIQQQDNPVTVLDPWVINSIPQP